MHRLPVLYILCCKVCTRTCSYIWYIYWSFSLPKLHVKWHIGNHQISHRKGNWFRNWIPLSRRSALLMVKQTLLSPQATIRGQTWRRAALPQLFDKGPFSPLSLFFWWGGAKLPLLLLCYTTTFTKKGEEEKVGALCGFLPYCSMEEEVGIGTVMGIGSSFLSLSLSLLPPYCHSSCVSQKKGKREEEEERMGANIHWRSVSVSEHPSWVKAKFILSDPF